MWNCFGIISRDRSETFGIEREDSFGLTLTPKILFLKEKIFISNLVLSCTVY